MRVFQRRPDRPNQRRGLIAGGLILLLTLTASPLLARPALDYFPQDSTLNPEITAPEDFFGFEVGQWHLNPEQINAYLRQLASESERVEVEAYARSHEQRPLLLAYISSSANIGQRQEIEASRAEVPTSPDNQQLLVLWMGYSVHGNEPSGANASVLLAYYLAASNDEWVEQLLGESMVLIDPTLNPDGIARFAQWVNSQRGTEVLNPDPRDREFNEPWPYSRTNHYWFDLNRDWLLLAHPESQGRIEQFHRWYPHVLTDFHEMGSNSTYFFQPGVPERTHPLTPQVNQDLTADIARFHAEELDRTGTLYWTREIFDDFYYGKGSTYPDIHGSVGILFEQASSRGHYRDTVNGRLAFDETVSNQFRLSLSTLRGAWHKRDELKEYQRDTFASAVASGRDDPAGAYLLDFGKDFSRAARLLDILNTHRIDVHQLARDTQVGEHTFRAGHSFVVSAAQPQYGLIRAIFERRTEFADETFYDVSAFNLADAFGFPLASVNRRQGDRLLGDRMTSETLEVVPFQPYEQAVAYVLDPRDFRIYPALQAILAEDLLPRLASEAVSLRGREGSTLNLPAGAVVLPVNERNPSERVESLLKRLSEQNRLPPLHAVTTGLAVSNSDLGSPFISPLQPIKPLLITGEGVNMYEAGEVWHLLDTRAGVPLTRVNQQHLNRVDLNDYTHVIMVSGDYQGFSEQLIDRLQRWISAGGHLLAVRQAAPWVQQTLVHEERYQSPDSNDNAAATLADRPYANHRDDLAQHIIGGAIFNTRLDTTHPVTFGLGQNQLPVLRAGTQRLKPSINPYETPLRYNEQPLLAGYSSQQRQAELASDPAVIVQRIDQGSVSLFADNPNFRGIWYGGNRLFLNALFFGQSVRSTALPADQPGN